MSKKVKCVLCEFADVEIPEGISVEEPYCEKCFEKKFGRPVMDNAINNADEKK